MPQLDPSSFVSQLFWLAISFGLLYVVLANFTLPRISGVLQGRRDKIKDDLDHADKLKQEAEAVSGAYEKSVSETRIKANILIADAVNRSKSEVSRKYDELEKVLQKKIAENEKLIEDARKKAIKDLVPVSAEISQMIVKEVANINVPIAKSREAVAKVISQDMDDDDGKDKQLATSV